MTRFLGGIWPVLQREMREGARRPVNHRLRFWSGLAAALLLWAVVGLSDRRNDQLGGWVFAWLHTGLLALIFLIVPALSADCLSRERREGTLGLLFLTPLSAGGIVAGKALTQALRALTFWLTALPALTVPFLAGGITWFDAFSALSLQFDAAVLCLAAGLLASTLARERNRVFILAYLFAALFLFLLTQAFQSAVWFGWWAPGRPTGSGSWWGFGGEMMMIYSGLENYYGYAGWAMLMTFSAVLRKIWIEVCLAGPPLTLLLFWLIARVAARRLERSWQDKGPSSRRESLVRTYCTPVFLKRFRSKMRRTLEWNPIAWLQQYSWQARLGKWLLCLAFLLVECVASRGDDRTRGAADLGLLFVMAGIYTFVGVGGFLEEKRNGALELLLVTPISVNKLIFGRVVGLWGRFLPGSLVLAYCFFSNAWTTSDDHELFLWARGFFVAACAFLTLPIFATYFALRVKNLIAAAVLTWVSLAMPVVVNVAGAGFTADFVSMSWSVVQTWMLAIGFVADYLAFALLTCFLLRHSLSRRIYSF